jgi:hypothetical protein
MQAGGNRWIREREITNKNRKEKARQDRQNTRTQYVLECRRSAQLIRGQVLVRALRHDHEQGEQEPNDKIHLVAGFHPVVRAAHEEHLKEDFEGHKEEVSVRFSEYCGRLMID